MDPCLKPLDPRFTEQLAAHEAVPGPLIAVLPIMPVNLASPSSDRLLASLSVLTRQERRMTYQIGAPQLHQPGLDVRPRRT